MKVSVVLADGIKQIMMTPENDNEKFALKMIDPGDDVSIEMKAGSFYGPDRVAGYEIGLCRGGYLRAWSSEDSVMFVLTPKNK